MRFVILVLLALPLAAASDISGKWLIEGDVTGYPVILNCSFEQKADLKIVGKCTAKGGEGTETLDISGAADGEKFKFSFTTSSGYTLEYTGTLQGDTIKGDIAVAGVTGTFTGKRSAE